MDSRPTTPAPQTIRELLGVQIFPGGNSVPCPEEATFQHVTPSCNSAEAIPEIMACHHVFDIPDNPPRPGPRSTRVHRFSLSQSRCLNSHLKEACSSWARNFGGQSVNISNVNSFHSPEEELVGNGSAWCNPVLLDAVSSAVDAAATAEGSSFDEAWKFTGWFNISTLPESFNALHDHGNAQWSVVYFAGAQGIESQVSSRGCDQAAVDVSTSGDTFLAPNFSGDLLLRFQLAPFTQHFGFFAVKPRPGDLWVFPGHVAHAVAPAGRVPTMRDKDGPEHPPGAIMRLSCAFNVSAQ